MRKVILNLAVSIDGFIEGPKGDIDWCFTDQDYGMTEFLNRVDTIFFGRKSYELMLELEKDPHPFPEKIKYVFSKSLKKAPNNTKLISANIETEVKNILKASGKDVWLFGGSKLITSMLDLRLVDEILLAVHPIFLAQGKPLVQEIKAKISLTLMDTKTYSSGLVQLYYHVNKNV